MKHFALAALLLLLPAAGAAQAGWECEGDCEFDGTGVLVRSDGARYEGQLSARTITGFGRYTGPDGVIIMGYLEYWELRDEGWHWLIAPDGVAVRPADGDSLLWGNEDIVALARGALALNEAFFEPGKKNDHWFTVDPFEGVWKMHREYSDGNKILEWPIGAVDMLFYGDHWLQLRCRDGSPCMLESEPDGDEEDYRKISLPGPADRDWESVERHVRRAMDAGLRVRAQAERSPGEQGTGS